MADRLIRWIPIKRKMDVDVAAFHGKTKCEEDGVEETYQSPTGMNPRGWRV